MEAFEVFSGEFEGWVLIEGRLEFTDGLWFAALLFQGEGEAPMGCGEGRLLAFGGLREVGVSFEAVVVEGDGLLGEGEAGVLIVEGPLDGGGEDEGVWVGGIFLEVGLDERSGAEVVALGEEDVGGCLLGS